MNITEQLTHPDAGPRLRTAVESIVEIASEMAYQTVFVWTGGLKFEDERTWVEITPADGDDSTYSTQWGSTDGHLAMTYDEIADEDAWLI